MFDETMILFGRAESCPVTSGHVISFGGSSRVLTMHLFEVVPGAVLMVESSRMRDEMMCAM